MFLDFKNKTKPSSCHLIPPLCHKSSYTSTLPRVILSLHSAMSHLIPPLCQPPPCFPTSLSTVCPSIHQPPLIFLIHPQSVYHLHLSIQNLSSLSLLTTTYRCKSTFKGIVVRLYQQNTFFYNTFVTAFSKFKNYTL